MTTPDDPLLGTVVDERYRIERKLERGGYEAVGLGNDRKVVIELLDPAPDHGEFERAARAATRIDHPGSLGISDFGIHAGRPFLVTEGADPKTLADQLAADGRMTAVKVVTIARPLVRGLAHAHGQGFVHGEITPRAIAMIDGKPRLRWSLPRATGAVDAPAADQVSASGVVRGTPTYMAPEQALGKPIDARTDLYAVSVILWELLVGKPPFAAREPLKLLNLHVNQAVPPMAIDGKAPGFVPPEIEAAIKHGLAKDPADRPHTAEEYLVALDAALAAVAARDADTTTRMSGMSARLPKLARLASKAPAPEEPKAKPRKSSAGAVVALLIVVAGAGTVFVATRDRKRPAATTPAGAPDAKTLDAKAIDAKPDARPAAPTGTGSATGAGSASDATPWATELADAAALIRDKRYDAAQDKLAALRRAHPDVAAIHRAMGDLFLARNWPEETLTSYRAAIAKDPALRTDAAIIAGAISLLDSNSRWWDAARFLSKDVDARAALAEAAEKDLTPIIRERAKDVLAKLPAP